MTDTKRTAAQIRAYCEAATPGRWRVEPDSRPDVMAVWTEEGIGGFWDGGHLIRHFKRYVSEYSGDLHVAEFAKYMDNWKDAEFVVNARTDLPRVLDVAAEQRRVIIWLEERFGHHLTRHEMSELEQFMYTTAWLADSPQPPLSPDGESGEESET